MCTLALFFQQSARYPLVVAANRDEFLDRPSAQPMTLQEAPWIVAGLDLVAGGTWLGVNQHGLVAGLLNRRTASPIDPLRRSRGLLCLDTLAHRRPVEAIAAVDQIAGDDYNPFNLLVASPEAAFVAQNLDDRVATTPLPPGVHLLTNLDVNDPTCPRIAKSHGLFQAVASLLEEENLAPLIGRLQTVLSDHSTPLDPRSQSTPDNLCVHRGPYGTRSSTLLFYAAAESRFRLFHAAGPPCSTPYEEIHLPPGKT